MKLKKNVNMISVVERLKELNNYSSELANDFTRAAQILDDSKLGIPELNLNCDESLARFHNCYNKISDLIKGL